MPLERRQHQLIVPDWSAEKNWNARQILRRRFVHQILNALIERPIDDHPDRAVVRIMRGNKKHGSAKVWVEHIWMRDQK